MRICGVVSSLGAGGAERVMLALCAGWRLRGHDVTLLTLDDGRQDFYAVPAGVERCALDIVSRSHSIPHAMRANMRRARTLGAALRRTRPDVIVSFTDRTNVLTLLAARGMDTPIIVSERNDPRHHNIGRSWNFLRRLTYPAASALVVQTEAVRRWADDIVLPTRVAVIPNALRPITTPTTPAGTRDTQIVALGRLTSQKGFDLLIRAFARVAGDFPTWRVTIFGEGPERQSLQALVHALDLGDCVTMPGTTLDAAGALASSAIFALPSRYEGFPNALLEAMSQGCACVASRCNSGPADMLADHGSGCLVPVDDVVGLADALATLMSDSTLRSRAGQRAQRAVERFSPDAVFAAWDRVFAMVQSFTRIAA